MDRRRALARSLLWSGGFSLLWAAAAVWRPELTYHLAPVIIAAAGPLVPALDGVDTELRPSQVWASGAIGLVLASGTTVLLSVAGWLQGPTLLPFGGPAVEAAVGAFVGAALGVAGSLIAAHRARSHVTRPSAALRR